MKYMLKIEHLLLALDAFFGTNTDLQIHKKVITRNRGTQRARKLTLPHTASTARNRLISSSSCCFERASFSLLNDCQRGDVILSLYLHMSSLDLEPNITVDIQASAVPTSAKARLSNMM